MDNPFPLCDRSHITPCGNAEIARNCGLCISEESTFTGQEIQFGSSPELFVLSTEVAVGTRVDGRLELLVHGILVIECLGVLQRPLIGLAGSFCCLARESGVVLRILENTGGKCHQGSKVVGGRDALLHHIALLVAVGRHHESFEVRGGQLVIYSAVVGVLHREHPLHIVHQFVEQVGRLVVALGDIRVQRIVITAVLLVRKQHHCHGIGRVYDVFVVVAGIVPAQRRYDVAAGRTFGRGCRGVNHHAGVGMSQRTGVFACILFLNRGARTHQVV